ncbi:ABC transporter ATP-binding protein [Natronobiforma cellulositropha]|uniref:ABC transporter ATP-binding protein n=1 Tax=Natronobiforma cellulositropha TaxID=1679076 RepID=UPI00294FFC29|nr:ABC transporter ATP-binding protein [Natronobiforma cellulositropha]
MSSHAVVATGVEKSFDGETVLEGVDLTVEAGETLVVMGPNGVGKSVFLSCLAGSERPSSGSVEVLGRPANGRHGDVSLLLQDALCLERLTGRENIAFYRRLRPGFTDEWREYASRLDIAADLEKRVEDYSGGMRRKLELTIALSVDAPIYVLDEPTAALDLAVIQEVHALLREKRRAGKTVVIASHLPMDADVADRLAFLTADGIVATGTPEALLESVPPVLTTADTNARTLATVVDGGRLYESDGSVRGLLTRGTSEDEADAIAEEHGLERTPATYTDLFNYQTNRSPPTNETADRGQ